PSSAPRTLRFVVVAVTGLGVADAGVATVGAAFGGPDAFALNATIWARYRWAAAKVWVAATDPAGVCTRSSVAKCWLLTDCRCVKAVSHVIVGRQESSVAVQTLT